MENSVLVAEQTRGFLGVIAEMFNNTPALQEELKGRFGWINMTAGLRTADNQINTAIAFKDGKATVLDSIPPDAEFTMVYSKTDDILDMLSASPDESYKMILRGRVRAEGNLIYMGLFNYLLNLVLGEDQQTAIDKQAEEHMAEKRHLAAEVSTAGRTERLNRRKNRLQGRKNDPGVQYLNDPYLSSYDMEDFPRLREMRREFLNAKCEFTSEYSKLITDFHVDQGYEVNKEGVPWDPNLRKAESLKYVLELRKPIIRKNDLIGGTWTTNPVLGAVGRPFAEACFMWGELKTCSKREYEPYEISDESAEVFHKYVFPYWANRNIHELWKKEYGNPIGAKIQELYFSIFYWATASQSENNAGFESVLKMGTRGLIEKIDRELSEDKTADPEKINTLKAMKITLEGVYAYANNLAVQAAKDADQETDPRRKNELLRISRNLSRVPEYPAETLDEAVQCLALLQICLGWESLDGSISFGRLDQVLQPYYLADIKQLTSEEERETYIKNAIELLGCFFMKISSRLIVAYDLASWQNSGASSDSCITVGGVTAEGDDAVNDMTYIILKVTEMLMPNDPNMHARYKPGKNSLTYLKRVAEVNYITHATPALHNDDAVVEAIHHRQGWDLKDIRNYASTGCVEPSIPGKHIGTTSALEINLVAPLEMALHNGLHPVASWELGPKTGVIENGDFGDFEEFYGAFQKQAEFILEQAVIGNNQIGEVYQRHQPHPLLSAITEGCIESGRGAMRGGAKYNSSGATMIGLSDVIDSLMTIKKLVFEDKKVSFMELKRAIDNNFENDSWLHSIIKTQVPRFGSGNDEALGMAKRVMRTISDYLAASRDFKGGRYTTGWWSMANHTTYGRVTNALPSGRLAGEPFTPGLTPHPSASDSLLDNLRDVARLDPETMDNQIAFNVKIVPAAEDSHEQVIDNMVSYMKTYSEQGGMQLQFNVIDSDTLKDAMAHPELYKDLIVRVSGYVARFTEIHHELQLELVRRAEYRL
ncbi:MAG: pyruvate formate lyase family protein [Bacillota bacterium]